MSFPVLVSVTRLRRQTTDVVRQVAESGRPVFVTQYGSVAMVLLNRRAFERLVRAAETREAPKADAAVQADAAAQADAATEKPAAEAARARERSAAADVAADPLAVFGQLPEGTLFETRWGIVQADTAAFFMEEGDTVKPLLSPERLQAALDAVDGP